MEYRHAAHRVHRHSQRHLDLDVRRLHCQGNEAFLTDSPGVDGGAYDIDYGNTKNSVIDNYGHDTQGYCVAVFGAGFVTKESRSVEISASTTAVVRAWPSIRAPSSSLLE